MFIQITISNVNIEHWSYMQTYLQQHTVNYTANLTTYVIWDYNLNNTELMCVSMYSQSSSPHTPIFLPYNLLCFYLYNIIYLPVPPLFSHAPQVLILSPPPLQHE